MVDDYETYLRILKQAQKDGERAITAYTGRTPSDTLADLTTGLPAGQIWVRINGEADPYSALYEDPSILQPNLAVKLIFDPEADSWVVKSINASVVIYDNGGATAPTFTLPQHDHTTDSTGGDLGADTVDTTNIVDSAITTAKINNSAVTEAKLATDAVTNAKVADNAIDTAEIVNSAVTNAKLATNAVNTTNIVNNSITPTKLDTLTGSSAELIAQNGSNTFTSIPYTLTNAKPMYFDGTNIRERFSAFDSNLGNITTSGTSTALLYLTPDLAGYETSNLKLEHFFHYRGTITNDIYTLTWQYNYDLGGVETWATVNSGSGSTPTSTVQILAANAVLPISFKCEFKPSNLTQTWGYSGAYKIRFVVARTSGSGAFQRYTITTYNSFFSIEEI